MTYNRLMLALKNPGNLLIIVTLVGLILLATVGADILRLTPLYLAFCLALVVYDLRHQWQVLAKMAAVGFGLGFLAEVIGVQTGLLFGDYSYGSILGPKVMGVPVLVGLLWALVTICLSSILDGRPRGQKVLAAGSLAVLFDIPLEHFAVRSGLWQWQGGIPVSNAVSWFMITVLIFIAFERLGLRLPNRTIPAQILAVQVIYFTLSIFML